MESSRVYALLRSFPASMPKRLSNTCTVVSLTTSSVNCSSTKQKGLSSLQLSPTSYQKFIHFALDETSRHTDLDTSPLQERYNSMTSMDGSIELQMQAFQAPKIRLLRSLSIETEEMQNSVGPPTHSRNIKESSKWGVLLNRFLSTRSDFVSSHLPQVLDIGVFPKPEYDLPIFCANFFSNASINIVLLDLNPLHDVITQTSYREKYYNNLMHLGVKYSEHLPWGGKLTSESLKFFSPIVIWTKFAPSQEKHDVLYSAFVDFYKAWLDLVDNASEETDGSRILCNLEAQHRYLTWRAEKDPGHAILKKLIGDVAAKDMLRNFLFNGINELGSKSFVDYFPEYRSEDGTVIERRSIAGKSFEHRPWDAKGEFIGNDSMD